MSGNTVFYLLASATKGGTRFIVLWAAIGFWSFIILTTCVAATILAFDDGGSHPAGEAAIALTYAAWLVIYIHALGLALWRKLR